MSTSFWPHQFVRTEGKKPVKIRMEKLYDHTEVPVYAEEFHCIHCQAIWMRNKDAQPVDSCPARSDKREMKRILNKPKLPVEKKPKVPKPARKPQKPTEKEKTDA